jgi:sec-independent protein translocase protein TatA
MFRQFGPLELVVVLVLALLIFGPKKLPELGQAIGKTIQQFRKSMGGESTTEDATAEATTDDEKKS